MNASEFEKYTMDCYLGYSVMTLAERAIPYVQDGFKPVHRRILYAMAKLGLTSTSSYKKSARIVGDVIGQYHPHGDTAVYDTMVKMSNGWYLRYPLVDGQGNFGSRDGDSPAAMRYTESRTTKIADCILAEINSGAIDYKPNFDGTMQEPEFLPSPLPMEILNGSEGIAVTMTSNVPSHNMGEVIDATIAYIKNNNISIEEIMEIIKGPDLPTGGQLVSSKEEILKSYSTGYGPLRVRARWEVQELAKKQWKILITELPPNISAQDLITKVSGALSYEPPKQKPGSKEKVKVNVKLLELKNFIKNNFSDFIDITDAEDAGKGNGTIKIELEPKSCKQCPEDFMNAVVSMLGLEETLKMNFNAVSLDRLPKQRNIKELIADWVEFRKITVTKRSETRLGKVKDRLELVLGRLLIMDVLDRVIEIIREEEEPKEALMAAFNLSERQAIDIMDIRLRELRKLEEYKLIDEKDKLISEKENLEALLSSARRMNTLLVKEITKTAEPFLDKRRTLIQPAEAISNDIVPSVASEPITVFVTKDGWLMGRKGSVDEFPDNSLKPGDKFVDSFKTKLDKTIVTIGKKGRSFCFQASSLTFGKGGGVHVTTLVSMNGDTPYKFIPYEEGKIYLMTQSEGHGFLCKSETFFGKQKAGKELFKLENFKGTGKDASIMLIEEVSIDHMINIWTDQNRLLQFPIQEINEYPKSQGMNLINLTKEERVLGYALSDEGTYVFKGKNKRLDDSYFKKRAAAPKKV
jgi:topoisomerase-4 subunit A